MAKRMLVTDKRVSVCGTRAVFERTKLVPGDAPVVAYRMTKDFRVACATCGAGGTVSHDTRADALKAAVRDSNKPCRSCGAS